MTESTPVPNITDNAVSGIDHEPLTPRGPSLLAGHPSNRPDTAEGDDTELRGAALEDALEARGLVKSGTADEKRARVVEYDAGETNTE